MTDGSSEQSRSSVRYELSITAEEARSGTRKTLTRKGKRLEVGIPSGAVTGKLVRLTNALQVTDGQPGDILIRVSVREESRATAGVLEVTDGSFEAEVLKSDLPVVVDFWAPWCGPCRTIAPVTEKLAAEYAGRLKVCKVNVDQNPLAAQKFQAMSIPLVLFFKKGEVVDHSVGAVPESQLRSKAEALLR